MASEHVKVTRGMVAAAVAIDGDGLTWRKAADRARLDPPTLGRVLKGTVPPGISTVEKLRTAFGTDANLWMQEADAKEREEWQRRMASMRQRAVEAVHGRAHP